MHYLIPEILEQVSAIKGEAERVAHLKKFEGNKMLKYVLALNFDPKVEFDLPKGEPPYKRSPHPINMAETNFYAESRRLYLVIKDHPRRPKSLKRTQIENIFIQMLEGINGIEADMFIALKDKELHRKYRGVTEAVVRQAFPGILGPDPEPKAKKAKEPA
jgi:hypothetical protein